jgi:hypothetical protein
MTPPGWRAMNQARVLRNWRVVSLQRWPATSGTPSRRPFCWLGQIADVLGHQSVASTGVYLKSSHGLLARCALDPDEPGRQAAR